MDKKDRRIRHLLDGSPPTDQDTNNLIHSFTTSTNNHTSPLFWDQSTTDIINTDIKSLSSRVPRDVSESTVIINDNHIPVTPLRRTVSGSSLDVHPSTFISSPRPISTPNIPLEPRPEIDFLVLNSLLDQLPHTLRHLHFRGILSKYLQSLQEHQINISTDRFIITIYNQLRKSIDNTKLEKVISIFVDNPANEAMKLSNFLYFREYNLKSRFIKFWIIKRRKVFELKELEDLYNLKIKKAHLSNWVLKYDVISDDFEASALDFRRSGCLLQAWATWKARSYQVQSSISFADAEQKKKFLELWKESAILRLEGYETADEIYKTNVLQRYLKNWKLRKVETSMKYNLNTFFQNWKRSIDDIHTLEEDGRRLEIAFHAGFFFTKWKEQSQAITSKESNLTKIADNFYMVKFFDNWLEANRYKTVENEVWIKRKEFLKSFVLRQWLKRLKHQKILHQYQAESAKNLKKRMFEKLNKQSSLSVRALQHNTNGLVAVYFKKWKLNSTVRFYENDKDYEIIEIIWKTWKNRALLQLQLKKYQEGLVSRTWDTWVLRKLKVSNALELSTSTAETYTRQSYLTHWKKSIAKNKENELRAHKFLKMRVLKKWKGKQDRLKAMEVIAIQFRETDAKSVTRSRFLDLWIDKNEEAIESRLSLKLIDHKTKIDESRVKAVFKLWNFQYHKYLTQEQIYKDEFLSKIYLEPIFSQWVYKLRFYHELELKANKMNALNLLSSGFIKMQLQLLKVQERDEKVVEFEEDMNLKLIMKFLKVWSLKSFKTRRDNETIQTFKGRWNRAHLRAILLLWKGKTLDSLDSGNGLSAFQEDTYGDDEDDDSPTKLKSRVSRVRSKLLTKTPQKSIFDPLKDYEHSSFVKSAIPGSEKIKRKRIEALRSHYSQIKYAIPSPLKSELKPRTIPPITSSPLKSSTKKLDFTRTKIPNFARNAPNPLNTSESTIVNGIHLQSDIVLEDNLEPTEFDNSFDDFEEPISSPIISHKNILQKYGSGSKNGSSSGLF